MKTKKFLLPCIAAVAIATFVGAKSFKTSAYESNDLLLANVEALTEPEPGGGWATLLKFLWKAGEKFAVTYTIWQGVEYIFDEDKVAYARWGEIEEYDKYKTYYPNGTLKSVTKGHRRTCKEFEGKKESNCDPVGKVEYLD